MRDANLAPIGADEARSRLEPWRVTAIVVFLVIAVALMFLASSYRLFQLSMTISYACAVLGLTILIGINGQLSLGHGAFYAVGAYATAILMANYDWPYWATIPVAAVAAGMIGFLVGFPALRLAGLYLALMTLALAVAAPQILKVDALSGLTGGVQGLTTDKPDAPFGLPLNPDQWIYLFSPGDGLRDLPAGWNLTRGRIGRAMMAIRDQPLAAESMGDQPAAVKTRTFAISAMFTGVAGALTTIAVQFVAPDSFNLSSPSGSSWAWWSGALPPFSAPCSAARSSSSSRTLPTISPRRRLARSTGLSSWASCYVMPTGVAGGLHRLFRRLFARRDAAAIR